MIRLVIADDHAIVRDGLRALLETQADFRIVGEAGDGRRTVEVVLEHRPDVLILDLSMPALNGVEAIARVRAAAPSVRVLVLSMHAAPEFVRPAVQAGAHGYIVKGEGIDSLVDGIRAVAAGETFWDRQARAVLETDALALDGAADDVSRLTSREREVLQLVAEGNTNRDIADQLGLSAKTVDTHRTNLMRKLDLHSAQELTRFAVRRGLVSNE